MVIERSKRPLAAARLAAMTQRLLDASTLCAIATVTPSGRAHVNTAYFAWSRTFELVWLSEPRALHSRNIRRNERVAVAVFDSTQSWGEQDRGIQLFGSGRAAEGMTVDEVLAIYARRFPDYNRHDLSAYRFYLFRPRRLKIFDERALGRGVFVTARLTSERRLVWERTEIYRSAG